MMMRDVFLLMSYFLYIIKNYFNASSKACASNHAIKINRKSFPASSCAALRNGSARSQADAMSVPVVLNPTCRQPDLPRGGHRFPIYKIKYK
jgi:hypothetical protein